MDTTPKQRQQPDSHVSLRSSTATVDGFQFLVLRDLLAHLELTGVAGDLPPDLMARLRKAVGR